MSVQPVDQSINESVLENRERHEVRREDDLPSQEEDNIGIVLGASHHSLTYPELPQYMQTR